MYSILLSLAIAALFGVGGMLLDLWPWGWALFFGFLAFLVAWIVIARRVQKRLAPHLLQVRKLMEQQMVDHAMQAMRDMLPLSRWMPMLRGQLVGQMGVLALQKGDKKCALEMLSQAPPRAVEPRLFLAALQYREGDKAAALRTLELSTKVNRKHVLLHNLYAWLLVKEGRRDDAIALLARFTNKLKTDEIGKANLLRLQNKNKMSMKDFGMFWYALGFERPPAEMGQLRQGRKGFRTPPMRKGG